MHRVCRSAVFFCALLACSSVLVAQSWSGPSVYPAGGDSPKYLLTADLLGNQTSDVLAVSTEHNLLLYQNDGAGHLSATAQTLAGNVTAATAARFTSTTMDDLLVIGTPAANAPLRLTLMPSDGSRIFGSAIAVGTQLSLDSTCQLTAADFNDDGIPDVLIACPSSNSLLIGVNNGKGVFTFKSVPGAVANGRRMLNVSAGDLDGDGLADLVVQSAPTYNPTDTRVDVLWNSSSGTFSPQQGYLSLLDITGLYAAKIDGHTPANLVAFTSTSVSVFSDQNDRNTPGVFSALQAASGCNVVAVTSGRIVSIKYSLGQDIVAAATCDRQNELLVYTNTAQTSLTLSPSLSYNGGAPALSLSVSVASSSGAVTPTGDVVVNLGATPIQGTLANGTSQIDVQPSPATNMLHVTYSGDSNDAGASETSAIVLAGSSTSGTSTLQIVGPSVDSSAPLIVGIPYQIQADVEFGQAGTSGVRSAAIGSLSFTDNGTLVATSQGTPIYALSPWASSDCRWKDFQWVGSQCAADDSGSYQVAYEQDQMQFTAPITIAAPGSNLVTATFVPTGSTSTAGVTQSLSFQVGTSSQVNPTLSFAKSNIATPSFSRLTFRPAAMDIAVPQIGIINTIAGNGVQGYSGEGGTATSAELDNPNGVAVDTYGNVYISGIVGSYGATGVSKIGSSTGIINVVPATVGPTGTAENKVTSVSGVATDSSGNLYLSDEFYVYEVAASSGAMHEVAGSPNGSNYGCIGTPSNCSGYSATASGYSGILGVTVDSSGNVYLVDGGLDSLIRKVTISTGIINTVAGSDAGNPNEVADGASATSAGLIRPRGVAVDSSGNVYVAESGSNRIRKVTASTGIISTVAGNGTQGYSGDGGAATNAELNTPTGVSLDSVGNLYIVDGPNNRIRKVVLSTGIISTIAGTGTAGFSGDGGPATSAELNSPSGVTADAAGNIYIADENNQRVRVVGEVKQTPSLSVSCSPNPIAYGSQMSTCTASLSGGSGSYSGTLQTYWDGNAWCVNSGVATVTCTGWDGQPAGGHTFSASYSGDSGNNSVSNSTGLTIVKANTTITGAFAVNPITYGQVITVSGQVSCDSACGNLQYFIDGSAWGINSLNTSGGYGAEYGGASAGSHSIQVNYLGDANHNPSSWGPATLIVNNPATSTLVWSNLNPSPAGQAVQVTAEVLGDSPTGNVAFTVDGNASGSSPPLSAVTTTNLMSYSNTFSSWSWTTGVTLTPNAAVAPDGSNSAWLDQVNSSYYILNSGPCSPGPITYSVFAKETATNTVTAFTVSRRYFDSSGSIISLSFSPVSISQNWQRYVISAVAPAGTASCQTGIEIAGNPVGAGLYLWGAQIENASSAGPYVPTGSSSASGTESIASIPLAGLTPGDHSLVAAYSGNDNASTSPAYTQVVGTTNSTSLLTSSLNPSAFNQNVTFTNVISTGGFAPTGRVNFSSDGISIGSGSVSSVSATNLAPFSNDFTKWSVDNYIVSAPTIIPNDAAGPDGSVNTASTVSYPTTNGDYADLTLVVPNGVAYANKTMTFSFWVQSVSGNQPLQPIITDAPYTGRAVVFGTCNPTSTWQRCSVTYTFSSNAGPGYQLYLRATGTTSPSTFNIWGAQFEQASNPGPYVATDGAAQTGFGGIASVSTSTLLVGTHTIAAVYAGDSAVNASTAPSITQVVNQATPSITLTSSVNPASYGQNVIFTAALPSAATGIVTFTDGGATIGTAAATGGVAQFATSALTPGTHIVVAKYSGDSGYAAASSSPLSQLVNQATASFTVVSSSNPSVYGATVTFTATGPTAATGLLAFYDGTKQIGTGTITGGSATVTIPLLAAGAHSITVQYPGDANFLTSTSSALTQTVNTASVGITINSTVNPSDYGQTVTFTFTFKGVTGGAVPTGLAVVTDGVNNLGTLTLNSSGVATFTTSTLVAGTHSITATYQGDSNYH